MQKLRPKINEVIIQPMTPDGTQMSPGGILMVNKYRKANLKFRVLAVGPAGLVAVLRGKKKKRVWREPEVEVGDCVICNAELDHTVVKHHFEDGTGRIVVDADKIMAKWRE